MPSIRNSQNWIKILLTLTIFCATGAKAELESHFNSSIPGVTIRNAHKVYQSGRAELFRGQAPKQKEVPSLLQLGVKRFLIFKNDTRGEVTKEINFLISKGVRPSNILHLEMKWNDEQGFQNACEMTLQALQFLEDSIRNQESAYFHCTMGEDRTGYLAGLWGLWAGTFRSSQQAFTHEMCARGYEYGNPQKPFFIIKDVREGLTPTWLKMVELLKQARLQGRSLKTIACPNDVPLQTLTQWRCGR